MTQNENIPLGDASGLFLQKIDNGTDKRTYRLQLGTTGWAT